MTHTNQPATHPLAAEDTGSNEPAFYWELSDNEQHHLRARNLILEDEGYLAHELNRGRRLLQDPDHYHALPTVPIGWQPPDRIEAFSDAIAAILQVALDTGHDLADICDRALTTQASVRRYSTQAAATRQRGQHRRPDPPTHCR